MTPTLPIPEQSLPTRPSALVWVSVLLSPTLYFVLLLLAGGLRLPELLLQAGWVLLPVVPLAALINCGSVVWSHSQTTGGRVGGTLLTLLAILLQCGMLFVVLYVAIVTAISM